MAIDIGIYALIFLPLALMIGVATSTIGFTAWSIFVPLAFVGMNFFLWDALFISVLVDLIDATILTVIYNRNGKVNFKQGGIYAVIAVVAAIFGVVLAFEFLPKNQNLLRGGVGYVVMLIGLGFFLRGRKGLQKQKTAQLETDEMKGTSQNVYENRSEIQRLFSRRMQIILMVIGVGLSGLLAGLLGIGSGMNFVLLFMIILSFDTRQATGTGCFIMAILMGVVGGMFFQLVNLTLLWPYLIIAGGFSAIGTLVGSHYVLKISEIKLNFVVGTIVIIAAVVSTVQSFLL